MATTEIRTTQNVTIEYELATLRDRFFAFVIDLFIFYFTYFILMFWVVLQVFGNALTNWGNYFFIMLLFIGPMAYHFLSEIFADGQTLGKRLMNIKVIPLEGRESGLEGNLIRSVFLLVDFFMSAGVIGALLIGSTFKSQRLGDLAANTVVVRKESKLHFRLSDILKINSLENYELQYPAVRQMSEADMLLIKNLLSRYQSWRNTAHKEAIEKAVQQLSAQLDVQPPTDNKQVEFLTTLIRDYIVLTR